MKRAEQREHTRARIVDAAVEVFAEHGYAGASTRLIAARAGANQGLVTYHFASKDELWRAAADQVFGILGAALESDDESMVDGRDVLRAHVRANAEHPEIFHFMVDAGRHDDERMHWLVDHHLRPRYRQFLELLGIEAGDEAARIYYAIAGASSLMFGVAPECRRLTGADPTDPQAIDAHVELLGRLFQP